MRSDEPRKSTLPLDESVDVLAFEESMLIKTIIDATMVKGTCIRKASLQFQTSQR